jgi:hypothetical protein
LALLSAVLGVSFSPSPSYLIVAIIVTVMGAAAAVAVAIAITVAAAFTATVTASSIRPPILVVAVAAVVAPSACRLTCWGKNIHTRHSQ